MTSDQDRTMMSRALELAARGRGYVEPNPMVGCVIAHGEEVVGEGWHGRFGGPHAEVEALQAAGDRASGASAYVTLEPCCHHGKTPPCSQALLDAGIGRVVVAAVDPFPQVDGGGIRQLRDAGVNVEVGLLAEAAHELNRPYLKLVQQGRPWVVAKWAMTLDGKIATHTGSSQWISGESSRAIVHELRGCMDAIIVGKGTAAADDPQLTARPPGPRIATRIVLDRFASLSLDSRLVQTADQTPVLIAVGPTAEDAACTRLERAGCEVRRAESSAAAEQISELLDELGRRRMTNVLVEGGGRVLGAMFDAQLVDEAHVFIAAKLVGGADAPSPIAGLGVRLMEQAVSLEHPQVTALAGDIYVRGRLQTAAKASGAAAD